MQHNTTQHRIFTVLLDEVDAIHEDLILHSRVRWLSRGKVLFRFSDLPIVIEFLKSKNKMHKELTDNTWRLEFSFLLDITIKLCDLNMELRGQHKSSQLISSFCALKARLKMWTEHLRSGCLHHWPHVELFCEHISMDCSILLIHMENLCSEFDSRFQDFGHIDAVVAFFLNTFNSTASPSAAAVTISDVFGLPQGNLELEILTLQSCLHLMARMYDNHFWYFSDA